MKEVPLAASMSQDRVNVSADDESMLVTTAVAMQIYISFKMAIAEEHTTSQYNIISHRFMQIPIMLYMI